MSLSHCPLCLALAVLSTVRGIGLAVQVGALLLQRRPPRNPVASAAAPLRGPAAPARPLCLQLP